MSKRTFSIIIFCVLAGLLLVSSMTHGPRLSLAQLHPNPRFRPIDLMMVIDNSCSMFPQDQASPGCLAWGSDPQFLRIAGADLFIARLGFSEVNEAGYQLGLISLGSTPTLISPLQPFSAARDALAGAIARPTLEYETRIVPALEQAYGELHSSRRQPANLPAVVLITDGVPYPAEGQSEDDIERLVSQNPDIPLFMMLLQNPASPSPLYDQYIQFWQQLQTRYPHIYTYQVGSDQQIQETYNSIVARLQDTIPQPVADLQPGDQYPFFVGRYVQKIWITATHQLGGPKANLTITDRRGAAIRETDPGVTRFWGDQNPVEVLSISAPRMQDDLKDGNWTIVSDAPVHVFADVQGAYRVQFLDPDASMASMIGDYLAVDRQPASQRLLIKFRLPDAEDHLVQEPQPIWGKATYPDGSEVPLDIPAGFGPDSDGIYTIAFDPSRAYPPVLSQPGRFSFLINAGSLDDHARERIPVAVARLLVDVGPLPSIAEIAPQVVTCAAGQPAPLRVTMSDTDLALDGTLTVQVLGGGANIALHADAPGVYSGDLAAACARRLSTMQCGTRVSEPFQLRLAGQLLDGASLPATGQTMPAQLSAATCTPTPTNTPTNTPTPTHLVTPTATQTVTTTAMVTPTGAPTGTVTPPTNTPTPRPPSGILQIVFDAVRSISLTTNPGVFIWLLGMIALVILAALLWWAGNWLRIHVIAPPPDAYVSFSADGGLRSGPISIKSAGRRAKTNRVKIGGDKNQADISFQGLAPFEFVVERQGNDVVVFDKQTDPRRVVVKLSKFPKTIQSHDGKIALRFALQRSALVDGATTLNTATV